MICQLSLAVACYASIVGASKLNTGSCTFINADNKLFDSSLRRIQNLIGNRFTVTSSGFCYEIGICTKANENNPDPSNGAMSFSERCDMSKGHTTIGRTNKAELLGHDNVLLLGYYGGDTPTSPDCNGNTSTYTQIVLLCSKHESLTYLVSSNCATRLVLETPSVCLPRGLSTGWIIIIIVSVLVTVYLVGGILYRRLVLNVAGTDQIPNVSFWKKLGHLAADGCDYCFRCGSLSQPGYTFDISHDDAIIQP